MIVHLGAHQDANRVDVNHFLFICDTVLNIINNSMIKRKESLHLMMLGINMNKMYNAWYNVA